MTEKVSKVPAFFSGFNINTVVTIAIAGLGYFAWINSNNTRNEVSQANFVNFQQQMREIGLSNQKAIEENFRITREAIRNLEIEMKGLPNLAARLTQLETDTAEGKARDGLQDQTLQRLHGEMIRNSTQIEVLRQAGNVQLPGSGTTRVR